MKYTQFFVMEIGKGCNLAEKHEKCPSGYPGRWANVNTDHSLTVDVMVGLAHDAHASGFRGNIAFHYYNEPTLDWGHLMNVIRRIKKAIPGQKFTLWTNGTLLEPTDELREFDQIWVSNYDGVDYCWLNNYVDRVTILGGGLDQRLTILDEQNQTRCFRPFNELVIDYHGNGRLCCMDWRGQYQLGNVFTDGFAEIVRRYQDARKLVANPGVWFPKVCRFCVSRQNHIANLVPAVGELTRKDEPWKD